MSEDVNLLELFRTIYPKYPVPIITTEVIVCDRCGKETLKNIGYLAHEQFYGYELYRRADTPPSNIGINYHYGFYCPGCKLWMDFPQVKRASRRR